MVTYVGKSILKGIAVGRLLFYAKEEQMVQRRSVDDVEAELLRYEKARAEAMAELSALYEKALKEVGEVNAAIFEVQSMMLEDDDFNDAARNLMESQKVNAEYAAAVTGDNFAKMFSEMEDEYFKARSADVKDVSERVVKLLHGKGTVWEIGDEPVILAAKDLAPSETVQMDKTKLLGFVTELGSSNSHTAILARTMNIPALIGVPVREDMNGKMAIIDGEQGIFYVDPDEETLSAYQEKLKEQERKRKLLAELKGKENVTLDGKKIELYANIGSIGDTAKALANDAGGIGLFRSEFLYLEKSDYPTEEEQFQAYKAVAETMAGKKVVIRTLDIGADKQVEYFGLDHEENPAMGLRAIRICLTRPEIFKTQLRALLRASAYGNLAIMYPMIISVDEVRRIKAIVEETKQEMKEAGIPYGEFEQGIMIETPAAVMMSDLLAKEVDFFSIGTNDLTQYTLAIDRQNPKLEDFYDPHHPAVLNMIRMTVENAHKAGIWAGICGELGADPELTKLFLSIGVDELSVSPSRVLSVRKTILETDVSKERDEQIKKWL